MDKSKHCFGNAGPMHFPEQFLMPDFIEGFGDVEAFIDLLDDAHHLEGGVVLPVEPELTVRNDAEVVGFFNSVINNQYFKGMHRAKTYTRVI
ncbi:hypothetical protein Trydic_g6253 [Trypoxylus dichotomus]